QVWRSALQFSQVLSTPMIAGAFAPHAAHFTASPNAIIFGERGPSRSWGFDRGSCFGFDRCCSRSLSWYPRWRYFLSLIAISPFELATDYTEKTDKRIGNLRLLLAELNNIPIRVDCLTSAQ